MEEDMNNVNAITNPTVESNTIDLTETSDGHASKSKRKREYIPKSYVWEHYNRVLDEKGKLAFGICKYCKDKFKCSSKIDIGQLSRHLDRCSRYPYKMQNKGQQLLSFSQSPIGGTTSVTNWEFDQERSRKALARMIIIDELPLKFVEKEGFKDFCQEVQPQLKHISRTTVVKDCLQIYKAEQKKLETILKDKVHRVCLTTDIWTSVQNVGYLCLTAHYIDTNWKLQKRIINFCLLPSPHTGDNIANMIDQCLTKWKINQICTITVDNATAHDVAVRNLIRKLTRNNSLLGDGEHFHVRCAAHIVNLIVKDGIEEVKESIVRIRNCVKYVKSSPARQQKFKECCDSVKISITNSLYLDVPTRWNSTFLMLQSALKYVKAFENLEEVDHHFQLENLPRHDDWEHARVLCMFLEHFYDVTNALSGSSYVTANQYFHEVDKIQTLLHDYIDEGDLCLRDMCIRMKVKFDKYWGSIDKMNMLLIIALVLDPRYKLAYVEFCYSRYFHPDEVHEISKKVRDALVKLFRTYQAQLQHPPITDLTTSEGSRQKNEQKTISLGQKEKFKQWKHNKQIVDLRTEVDRYFDEELEEDEGEFDILAWWATSNYRVLSCIAKDILAIPVSTVASESAFSTGGRLLDQYKSSLTPSLVECLICSQDWLRSMPRQTEEEDHLAELEQAETESWTDVGPSTTAIIESQI